MKKIVMFTIICTMILSSIVVANASEINKQEFPIDNAEEFISEIEKLENDNASKSEVNEVINDTDPEVYQEVRENLIEESMEVIDNVENNLRISYDDETAPSVTKETFELTSGGIVEVELRDEPVEDSDEDETVGSKIKSLFFDEVYAINKGYGNRKYTVTHTLMHLAYPDTKLVLVTLYSIGNYGLKIRDAHTDGTRGIGVVSVSSSAWAVDRVATKPGANINAAGGYDVRYGPLPAIGLTALTNHVNLRSSVKLAYINKTGKYADVVQSYTKTKDTWSLF